MLVFFPDLLYTNIRYINEPTQSAGNKLKGMGRMMKRTHRLSAMFLAALLAMSTLASCGGDGGAKNDTDPADVTTASGGDGETSSGESDETTIAPLEKRDLGGRTINAFIRTEWDYEFVIDEESVGDTVSDAIYERNRAVEDKYNCKLNFIEQNGAWGSHTDFTNTIHNSVVAGDGEYDFIAGYQAVLVMNILNGDLMNLYDVPNIQPDAPWWTQAGVDALTYNGKCFEIGGDISVSLLEGINCMFYNKKIAEDFSSPDFYQLVRDGKWTHDKMLEVTKGVYQDLDGDGVKSSGDMYGFTAGKYYIRPFVVNYDTPTISKTGELIWNNEHTINVVERIVDFSVSPDVLYTEDNETDAMKIFSDGRALLFEHSLGISSKLRDMNDDFGIIPLPKFDENQAEYKTTTKNDVSMMCVPITASDLDVSGFVLEAMCRESTDTVAKAFYETALKGKYARDDESLEMINLIRQTLTFDFGWVASMATGVSGAQYQVMVEAKNKNFSSWYAANETTIQEKTALFLAAFE